MAEQALRRAARRGGGDRAGAPARCSPSCPSPGSTRTYFVDGIDPQYWAELNNSPDRPLNNRAIAGTYPPGSTFKPFMALAALELGKRTPRSTINDPGYFVFGDRRFRDSKPGGHGVVDLFKSIVVSSDTYYYMLANDMGIDAIAGYMKHFGFGAKTGIDLQGELPGVLPSPEWKMKRFRRPEQQRWYAGETISIGIGQGYNSYTPMQLAQAMATLANGGTMYRPRLVAYIDNPRTGERRHFEPEIVHRVPAQAEHIDFVKRAMAGVNKEGTGARAFAGAPVHERRQDRHRAGDRDEAEREIRREEGRRAPPRPFAGSSPSRRSRARRSRWRSSSRTAASARAPPRRSRAPCSTTTCSARCRRGCNLQTPEDELEDEDRESD